MVFYVNEKDLLEDIPKLWLLKEKVLCILKKEWEAKYYKIRTECGIKIWDKFYGTQLFHDLGPRFLPHVPLSLDIKVKAAHRFMEASRRFKIEPEGQCIEVIDKDMENELNEAESKYKFYNEEWSSLCNVIVQVKICNHEKFQFKNQINELQSRLDNLQENVTKELLSSRNLIHNPPLFVRQNRDKQDDEIKIKAFDQVIEYYRDEIQKTHVSIDELKSKVFEMGKKAAKLIGENLDWD